MYALLIAAVMLGSVWYGGAPLHQLLAWHEVIFYGVIFGISYLVFHWLLVFRQRALAIVFLMALGGLCGFAGGTYRYVNSDMDAQVETQNIPVSISFAMENGKRNGVIFVRNEDPIRNLVRANVLCKMFYDNGKIVEKDFWSGIGGPNVYEPGQGKDTLAWQSYQPRQYRANPDKINCRVTRAEFIQPLKTLELRWEQNADGFQDFFVKNLGTTSVKNVQFSCTRSDGIAEKVMAYPSYDVPNTDTVVHPGETAKYTSDTKWFTYTSCVVMNALEI